MEPRRINVLIVDDSLAVRALLRKVLESEKNIESLMTASNGKTALQFITEKKPDVVILDMNMPEKNGLEVITEIRAQHINTPIILFSTAGQAPETIKALQFFQVDFLAKDEAATENALGSSLEDNVKKLRLRLMPKLYQFFNLPQEKPAAAATASEEIKTPLRTHFKAPSGYRPDAIAIASSTGGPRALEEIFKDLHHFADNKFGPIFITQHMPAGFTLQLAERLSKVSGLTFKEAKNLEAVKMKTIYIAPGGYHMEIHVETDGKLYIALHQKEMRHSVRPSAEYMFESLSPIYKRKILNFVLTGMGDDGIDGIHVMKKNGALVVTQTAETCAVYGMPRAIDDSGLSDGSENLEMIRKILIDNFLKS